VGAFVGTYWQVGDNAAGAFAEHFYRDLLESKTVGEALRSARKGLYKTNEADWVNYIHYGDSEFKVKSN
jgi:CHAT domain-containing protein